MVVNKPLQMTARNLGSQNYSTQQALAKGSYLICAMKVCLSSLNSVADISRSSGEVRTSSTNKMSQIKKSTSETTVHIFLTEITI